MNIAGDKFTNLFENTLAHAVIGCGSAVMGGGRCGAGAMAGGFSAATANAGWLDGWGKYDGAVVSAMIGGTASMLGGGSFQNGAITGAFGYLFNCMAHPLGCGDKGLAEERRKVKGYLNSSPDAGLQPIRPEYALPFMAPGRVGSFLRSIDTLVDIATVINATWNPSTPVTEIPDYNSGKNNDINETVQKKTLENASENAKAKRWPSMFNVK